jgi:membrane protease YdiL (CAAX protease family)
LNQNEENLERYQVSPAGSGRPDREWKFYSDYYRKSKLSYVTLFFLLIVWPALSLTLVGDPAESLRLLSESPIALIYLPTMITQWLLFLLVFLTVKREKTGLLGVGFTRIRMIDFLWALAFILISNLLLTLLSLLLEELGLTIVGEIELILPKTTGERIFWVILSLTAAVCEETAFRGYLITRLKILGKTKGWIIPVILASLAFGTGHSYQGVAGFILITAYGIMFGILFLKTRSLWPPIIAHFFQDFSALFYPFQR